MTVYRAVRENLGVYIQKTALKRYAEMGYTILRERNGERTVVENPEEEMGASDE